MTEEKTVIDYLKKVSPGTFLRTVINDLIRAGDIGGLIVFDSPGLEEIIEGGFKVNCKFTTQRLFELCKMDGAVIVSPDLKRIIYANVILNPNKEILSNETGTRHKAAERTAKQANTLVIAISERRKKTTLFFSNTRYVLKKLEELMSKISSNLQVLEKQREIFNDLINRLNILEISDLVSIIDVCQILQRAEIILKVSESIKRNFIEIGKEGNVMNIRYRELLKNIEKIEDKIIQDYSPLNTKRTKTLLSDFTIEELFQFDEIALLIFKKQHDESISSKGYRFLSNLKLDEETILTIVKYFHTLPKILDIEKEKLKSTLKNPEIDAEKLKQEIDTLREQILTGKEVF